MQTQCSTAQFAFARVEGRPVVASLDGGAITSDAGAVLLKATDRAIGLLDRFAGCFVDRRRGDLIEHDVRTLVGQRVFGIALGYEDLNDHDHLRHDPIMAVLAGKLEARLHSDNQDERRATIKVRPAHPDCRATAEMLSRPSSVSSTIRSLSAEDQRRRRPPTGEGSRKDLTRQDSGAGRPDAPQARKHVFLPFDGRVVCIDLVAFSLDLTKLRLHRAEAGIFAFEFAAKPIGQRVPFSRSERREVNAGTPEFGVDAANALREQQPLDAIDVAGPFPHKALTFAVGPTGILLGYAGHPDDGADVTLAPVDCDHGPQKGQRVDPVGLDPARPAIDLKACRVENMADDAVPR